MAETTSNSRSPQWTLRTKRTVTLIVLLLLGLLLWQVANILPIIIIAALLSYLLTPVVNVNERILRRVPGKRTLAVLGTFVFVLLLIALVLLVILPVLINQVQELGTNLPETLAQIEQSATEALARPLVIFGREIVIDGAPFIPLDRLRQATGEETLGAMLQLENLDFGAAAQGLLGSLGGLTGSAFTFLGRAFSTAVNLTLLLVMMFYLMKDGHVFLRGVINMTPKTYEGDARRFLFELGDLWNAYLRGQLILCLLIGVVVFVAMTLLGVPNAPILGLIAGILEFVPNIGPFLSLIPAVLLALVSQSSTVPFLEGGSLAVAVTVVYLLVQQFEAFVVVPRVMGDNLNLHPFVVIVAVLAGASLAGILGVLLAAPFVASGRLVLQYVYGKLTDADPFNVPAFTPPERLRKRYRFIGPRRLLTRIRRKPENGS